MSAWGDGELLVELLDRQFAYLLGLGGTRQILRLSRVLAFLQSEPQTAAILDDLRVEAEDALGEYELADAQAREQLERLWTAHGSEIRHRLNAVDDDSVHGHSHMDRFEENLARRTPATFTDLDDVTIYETESLIRAVKHWWTWSVNIANETSSLAGQYAGLGDVVRRLLARYLFAARRLREMRTVLAWPAYRRLVENASVTNPVPPDTTDEGAWLGFANDTDFATTVRRADVEDTNHVDGFEVDAVYGAIKMDAKVLHEEIRLRLGLARSRAALIQRYAARCEAFDADRLREACDNQSTKAERLLTLELARFLFDAGLRPLMDATVSGLRPDVLHVEPASLFYVEAKQYADAHPRPWLIKAYAQVWGTWGRLRKTYPSTEAFLLVFRRSGPWVDLPSVIHHQGLRLYSVVADISTEAGSREKSTPIRLTEDELRPKGDGE